MSGQVGGSCLPEEPTSHSWKKRSAHLEACASPGLNQMLHFGAFCLRSALTKYDVVTGRKWVCVCVTVSVGFV